MMAHFLRNAGTAWLGVALACGVATGAYAQASDRPREPQPEERREDELDDLVATDLAVSQPFPLPGERLTITGRVENRAEEAARGVVVRLLADGRKVAESRADIAGGASYEVRGAWQAPAAAGVVTLALVVDPEAALSEANRSDNRREL